MMLGRDEPEHTVEDDEIRRILRRVADQVIGLGGDVQTMPPTEGLTETQRSRAAIEHPETAARECATVHAEGRVCAEGENGRIRRPRDHDIDGAVLTLRAFGDQAG